MCGINGIISVNASADKVGAMNNALIHRGPDDGGVLNLGKVVFGQRRLSIIDLSSAGHQPMTYANEEYIITFNGEIYNYQSLRTELISKGYIFKTNTDTEVILASYAAYGTDCVQKLDGMFAFALYDVKAQTVFFARDRFGKKPLYYSCINNVFVFSSEVRAILASGVVPRKLNKAALSDYLRYQTVHAPNTIIQDIFMLMPAHTAVLDIETLNFKSTCYWDIAAKAQQNCEDDYATAKHKVKDLLYQSVEKRLVADVPFGAFLSGGIDSSAIVGIMSELLPQKVKTFAITFHEKQFDESIYSSMVAKKFNTQHTEIKLSADDFKKELPNALNAMDHPSGDGPNTYLVSKVTREAGITMALSGLGGDELFAGYDIFKRNLKLQQNNWLNAIPLVGRKLLANLLLLSKKDVSAAKIAAVLRLAKVDFTTAYPIVRQILLDNEIAKLTHEQAENRVEQIIHQFGNKINFQNKVISFTSISEINTYMQNVLLRDTDQMSMASALEVRVPFLDYKLAEYVLSLPDAIKFPASPKKLLVESLGDMLPPEIVNRPKMGFTFPWSVWMKNDLKPFCEDCMNALAQRSYFNKAEVLSLWTRFLNNDPLITWSRVWPLIVLENWLQQNNID